ncbi:mitochondrial coenzyme A transporter SLC25A42 isoform X3 [Cephus cinctus]|uniref:Mitochondrial coenzyme A transporter SLC25A42 isoform X3 n=1 Tax=Cephus cinctus TaxID=211228 RepID=A0AAJ7VZH7_CEPCN|nr:mitochondrial coenzyme A transporter SLC25A42 isoform X3 [Cephus cinctus]XP_015590453.1 mitochondrial coenzyme A transporter SLC25A42 isoform X3 [Cephus cinctus]XP_024938482.1 mitochondrial coenzyme A transporter SLC25A42 isoform X3 [Cephus cinctus]XP_024938483.1 mitochondrial coenzyme A transporter SLC25A42 isoform X3 [Cephus cinctus]
MSGHVAPSPVDGSQVVLERIQVSVMPGITKSSVPSQSSSIHEILTEEGQGSVQQNISNTQRVLTSLLAGAIAGALAKTTIAPLDRTKINFQISKMPYSAKAAIEFLVNSYKKDGLLSLWRGNSATMARIVPYAAIQFTAHEQWKRLLHVNGPETTTPVKRFLAGSLAGVTSQSLTYPLDLARARMAVTKKAECRTLRQMFSSIYRQEGIIAFYRGFTPTILGVVPYAGFSFFTYDTLKNVIAVYTVNRPGLSAMSALICGAVAGMVGQTSSYPLDIVRRRMQTSAIKGQHYHTIYTTTVKIYTEEGIMAFFKGLSMNWVKGPVAVGISFATYDVIKDSLRKIIC